MSARGRFLCNGALVWLGVAAGSSPAAPQAQRWSRVADSLWAMSDSAFAVTAPTHRAGRRVTVPRACEAFTLHPDVAPRVEVPDHCMVITLPLSDSAVPDVTHAVDSVLDRASMPYGVRRRVRDGWMRVVAAGQDARRFDAAATVVVLDSSRVRIGFYAEDDATVWRHVENVERAAQMRAVPVAGRVPRPPLTAVWEHASIGEVLQEVEALTLKSFILGRGVENMTISGAVRDQPWDVALREILEANGLRMIESAPGIVRIER